MSPQCGSEISSLGEQVQLFTRLETDGLARSDSDFGPGAGVASNAGLAWLDCEDTEAAEFNAVTGYQGLFHAVEDGIDRRLSLGSWEPGAFYNALYEVLFNHEARRPWVKSCEAGRYMQMVESGSEIVNDRTLP
jgi:hypothetical protein